MATICPKNHRFRPVSFDEDTGQAVYACKCGITKNRQAGIICKKDDNVMEIAIGSGDREMVTVRRDGRIGVLLSKSAPYPVGEFTGSVGQEWNPSDEDVLIWIDGLESGRILQDTLSIALLKLQKVPIETGDDDPSTAISQAMLAVEKSGCHPLLTDAVVLLEQANGKIAKHKESRARDGR